MSIEQDYAKIVTEVLERTDGHHLNDDTLKLCSRRDPAALGFDQIYEVGWKNPFAPRPAATKRRRLLSGQRMPERMIGAR